MNPEERERIWYAVMTLAEYDPEEAAEYWSTLDPGYRETGRIEYMDGTVAHQAKAFIDALCLEVEKTGTT